MTKYPAEQKEETRKRILKAAGRVFRERGVEAASLPDVMDAAGGLTVGGFYRHFESKDALFRETLARALEQTLRIFEASGDGRNAGDWLGRAADVYLSMAHRENIGAGCVLPALASDVARATEATRQASESMLVSLAHRIAERMDDSDDPHAARERAWAFLATLVGGLLLSRCVVSDHTAQTILNGCRTAISDSAREDAT